VSIRLPGRIERGFSYPRLHQHLLSVCLRQRRRISGMWRGKELTGKQVCEVISPLVTLYNFPT